MNSITLPMAELKPALAGLSKIIGKRTTLPVLNHVRVERTKTGQIQLAATDLDTAAIVTLDALAQGEAVAFLVPHEDLNNVAKSCGRDDTLLITAVETQRVALRFPVGGTHIEHRCESLPVEEFPPIAEITGAPAVLDENLRRAIHHAIDCASTDTTRLILNGAYLDVSKREGHYVVGTDGRHLFSSNSFALPLAESFVIPSHRFLAWKEFNTDGDWRLRVAEPEKDNGPQFEIASNHWRFIARSFSGNYPNWRAVVPGGSQTQTTLEIEPVVVDEIVRTIVRMPNHDTINYAIGVETKGRKVSLLGKSSSDDPWTRIELEGVTARGADVTVRLNRNLLTKALRFGLMRLEIIDATAPVRFSDGGRQMIVMPIRPDATPQPTPPNPPPASAPAAADQHEPTAHNLPPNSAEPRKENHPMPEQNGNTTAGAKRSATSTSVAEKPALETALAQIETIKGSYRDAIRGLTDLADTLKQVQREQKASDKEIMSVRQTLQHLKAVRI